jgi:hypothetical protein
MPKTTPEAEALTSVSIRPRHEKFGFRSGDRGTHTSRTLMYSELQAVLGAVSSDASREVYASAIVEDNVAGKHTAATRGSTNQRLGELYGLDPSITLFRVFRRFWEADQAGRPLLALLCSLARDPLLRATAAPILVLREGEELGRQQMTDAIREATGNRLNDAILDKVARNASSSWAQSGHLVGRVRKLRKIVEPTPLSTAYAIVLGYLLGVRGAGLLETLWAAVLDAPPEKLTFLAMDAKRIGVLNLRHGGGVLEIDLSPVLTQEEIRGSHGTD